MDHPPPRYSLRVSVFQEPSRNYMQNYTRMHIYLPDSYVSVIRFSNGSRTQTVWKHSKDRVNRILKAAWRKSCLINVYVHAYPGPRIAIYSEIYILIKIVSVTRIQTGGDLFSLLLPRTQWSLHFGPADSEPCYLKKVFFYFYFSLLLHLFWSLP